MALEVESGWTRRDFASASAWVALVLGVPLAAVRLSDLPKDHAPTEQQLALLREVSQLVIPRTQTAGAGELGVGEFVALALAHGLENSRKALPGNAHPRISAYRRIDGSLDHIRWLKSELDSRSNGDFLRLSSRARAAALGALDAEAYSPVVEDHPWRTLKALVLTGYYTTEIGGAKELRFELVPGRWDADLPATPQTIAFSSDWTAVDFG